MTLAVVSKAEIQRLINSTPTLKRNPGWGKSKNKIIICYNTAVNKKYIDPKTVSLDLYANKLRNGVGGNNGSDFKNYLDRLKSALKNHPLAIVQKIAPIHTGILKPIIVAPKPPTPTPTKAIVVAPKPIQAIPKPASTPGSVSALVLSNANIKKDIAVTSSQADKIIKTADANLALVAKITATNNEIAQTNERFLRLLEDLGL